MGLRALRKRSQPRPKTLNLRKLARAVGREAASVPVERPRTRGECEDGPRPCPWVGCRFHLYLDADDWGHVKLNFPHLEPGEIPDTCALDVVDEHPLGVTLDEVARRLNVTRERVRQIEERALTKTALRVPV